VEACSEGLRRDGEGDYGDGMRMDYGRDGGVSLVYLGVDETL
jgi:hypothetical protein